jgi:hypothetical protein
MIRVNSVSGSTEKLCLHWSETCFFRKTDALGFSIVALVNTKYALFSISGKSCFLCVFIFLSSITVGFDLGRTVEIVFLHWFKIVFLAKMGAAQFLFV